MYPSFSGHMRFSVNVELRTKTTLERFGSFSSFLSHVLINLAIAYYFLLNPLTKRTVNILQYTNDIMTLFNFNQFTSMYCCTFCINPSNCSKASLQSYALSLDFGPL